jgi:hydrogenase/urease accessory protein HupE
MKRITNSFLALLTLSTSAMAHDGVHETEVTSSHILHQLTSFDHLFTWIVLPALVVGGLFAVKSALSKTSDLANES